MPPRSPSDIPIDPALLDEPPAGDLEDLADDLERAGADQDLQALHDESSDLEDNDEDAYVDEQADRRAAESSAAAAEDDAVFNRLAGYVAQEGGDDVEGGVLRLGGKEWEREMARLDEGALPVKAVPDRRTRSRRTHKPSHETQRLLGQANMAYAQSDTQRTISLFLEVIRHDPHVISAWNTLGNVYDDLGREEEARQMRFFAAHLEDEGSTWTELAGEFRQKGQISQCVYCLRRALRKDTHDVATLFELASIYRLQDEKNKAIEAFRKIIKIHPHSARDFTFLSQFHSLILGKDKLSFATTTLRTAYDYHLSRIPNPDDPRSTMRLEHVVMLVDDMMNMQSLEEAVSVAKRGQRWLQGRILESWWDGFDDDREYDPQGVRRGEETEDDEGEKPHSLDVNLRHRLALLRIKMNHDDDATIHLEELLNQEIAEYSDLIVEVANALMAREQWERALECFGVLQECDDLEADDPKWIYSVGVCQLNLKAWDQAKEAFDFVIAQDPTNLEAKLRIADVYTHTGKQSEALELIEEVLGKRALQDKPVQGRGQGKMTKAEYASERQLTRRTLEDQMRQEMQSLWGEVQIAEAGIENGEYNALDDFVQKAGIMIENFRMARTNFAKNRGVSRVLIRPKKESRGTDLTSQALEMHDRLQRAMGLEEDDSEERGQKYIIKRQSEFYGLDAEEWLSLIVKFCCVLLVRNEADLSMDILDHMLYAGLFNNWRSEVALRMTIIACCMRSRSFDKLADNCRRLAQLHQFRPEPFLVLLGAMGGGGGKAQSAFQTLQFQKFLHRELRIHDALVKGQAATYNPQNARWLPVVKLGLSRNLGDDLALEEDSREGEEGGRDGEEHGTRNDEREQDEVQRPTKPSPTLNALYGAHMLAAKAYQSSLFYLLRAYEANQYDPLICFLIAQAFIGRAGNRQSDNRNYQIAQALAFMTKYRDLSGKDGKTVEEVEYNFGRCFHGIGVAHLAVEHYERVLVSVQRRMAEAEDSEAIRLNSLAYEAAHNLVLIYASAGTESLVKEKSKWLAI